MKNNKNRIVKQYVVHNCMHNRFYNLWRALNAKIVLNSGHLRLRFRTKQAEHRAERMGKKRPETGIYHTHEIRWYWMQRD